jgi:hypothetical protein
MPCHLPSAVPAYLAAALFASLLGLAPVGPGDRPGAPPNIAPRTVTLKGNSLPLGRALAELTRQTGIAVHDRRGVKREPNVKLALDRATFWQAVDALAHQAGAGLSLYQPDGVLALVEPPARLLPVSHDGLFRTAVKGLTLRRDLETGAHSGLVQLEVAWEPGFQPLLLEVKSYEATFARDARGHVLHVKQAGTGQRDAGGPAAAVELPLPAPDRSAPALAELKGSLAVVGSATMRTVRFDRLAPLSKGGKPQTQTAEPGVTVTLRKLSVVDTDRWEAEVALAYPPGGPRFESFRDWLVNNKVYLEKGSGAGRRRFVPGPADQRVVRREFPRAVVQYDFVEGKGTPRLGAPGDWTLVYELPGRIVEVPASFSFRNLSLP